MWRDELKDTSTCRYGGLRKRSGSLVFAAEREGTWRNSTVRRIRMTTSCRKKLQNFCYEHDLGKDVLVAQTILFGRNSGGANRVKALARLWGAPEFDLRNQREEVAFAKGEKKVSVTAHQTRGVRTFRRLAHSSHWRRSIQAKRGTFPQLTSEKEDCVGLRLNIANTKTSSKATRKGEGSVYTSGNCSRSGRKKGLKKL